ncbi:MAG: hypothetical protein GEU68_14875 [Actinobacteria bacterium]|nr:hypothetical protein [Actinomycetota bacterium]
MQLASPPTRWAGWFLAAGIGAGIQQFAWGYATYGLVARRADVALAEVAAWVSGWTWMLIVALVGVFSILLFPNGRLLSSRWRPAVWLCMAGVLVGSFGSAVLPGPMDGGGGIANPFAVENPSWLAPLSSGAGVFALNVSLLLAAASLMLRFRRAAGVERAQIKWLALGAGLVAAVFAFGTPILALSARDSVSFWLTSNVILISLTALPASIAIAILRFRLYDIDRIVSRTIAYAILTAVLVGGYALAILVLQSTLPLDDDSPLIVAASTLAVVVPSGRLRSRIQTAVDRRFNRRRYDAQATIEAFATRLREQTDIAALESDLITLVSSTVEPAHASLWLAPQGTEARPSSGAGVLSP